MPVFRNMTKEIKRKEDSAYNVTFPDLPQAITCGDTLEQAMELAKECLALCLKVRIENRQEIPMMSEPYGIHCINGMVIHMIDSGYFINDLSDKKIC